MSSWMYQCIMTIPDSVTYIGDFAFLSSPCEGQMKRLHHNLYK